MEKTVAHEQAPIQLKRLLISTPTLGALECDFELDAEPHNGPSAHLDCEALRNSILPVRSTLRSLKVSLEFVAYIALEVDAGVPTKMAMLGASRVRWVH